MALEAARANALAALEAQHDAEAQRLLEAKLSASATAVVEERRRQEALLAAEKDALQRCQLELEATRQVSPLID